MIAAATWWLAGNTEDELRLADGPDGARSVDYYLRDLDFVTYSAQGDPARALKAPELRHYPDDDSTELDAPRLVVFKPGRPPWPATRVTGRSRPTWPWFWPKRRAVKPRDLAERVVAALPEI